MTRERFELAENIGQARKGRNGKVPQVTIASSPESDEYGMMRLELVETLEQLNVLRRRASIENLYRELSEEWIRKSTITGGMGIKFAASVIIRLNKDYTVKNAHIEGPGGQKIAEQMLKDSPEGVDVYNLKVPRRIVLYADNGWPSAILSLDANNRNTNVGSYIEGNWGELQRFVMSHGLPSTKELTGD
jgi:hypothetical protein